MPKINIKVMKYAYELKNEQKKLENNKAKGESKSKKMLTINKTLLRKIDKKMDKNMENNANELIDKKETQNNLNPNENNNLNNPNEKITVSSTIMRNLLIVEIKQYYCKYLSLIGINPCSRMGATFTNCFDKLYLFGGLLSNEQNDLWAFEIKKNVYKWQKINYLKNVNLNIRYGHSCVLFNNSLYIFGGNMNLKKLKYPLEDILIYNIKTNEMKIGSFKMEKYSFTSQNLYIPQRRNHIAHAIGWNMIVHGGIDISKEYLKENYGHVNEEEIRINEFEIKNMDIHGNVLGDFMALDLITLKWMKLSNIVYKLKSIKSKEIKKWYSKSVSFILSCFIL